MMLRSGINNMIVENCKEEKFPFFSWDCLTIELEYHDVDIIIRNESQMSIILKALIIQTNSFEGKSGTLKALKDLIKSEE